MSYTDNLYIIESLKLDWNEICMYYDTHTIDYLVNNLKYNIINLYKDINWNNILLHYNEEIIIYFLKISYKSYDLQFTIDNNNHNSIDYFNNAIIENDLGKLILLDKLIPNGLINLNIIKNCTNKKILNWINVNMPKTLLSYKTKHNFCFTRHNNINKFSSLKCNCKSCGNGIGWSI